MKYLLLKLLLSENLQFLEKVLLHMLKEPPNHLKEFYILNLIKVWKTMNVKNVKEELEVALNRIKELEDENKYLKTHIETLQHKINYPSTTTNQPTTNQLTSISTSKIQRFSYKNLLTQPKTFSYLCGLSPEKFNLVYDSVVPYTDSIVYPDCKGTGERTFDKGTELLAVLTICRHALHLGVIHLFTVPFFYVRASNYVMSIT